ncbi:helix-turn-helix domain-containing protein [Paenibacillus sp. IB182496]|uniref:Helix-turn-helix domain-containing protein n=1 Tax=Paenibacillus sabuli TaxID=2772509 RepID=A0A927GQT4_9BACL|nr:AraC family transcriptional regulator [Paenibacillus sabuli]MBD2844859.1 helix-turn-helix domain-containing protein [Paenibacillus sabuli]
MMNIEEQLRHWNAATVHITGIERLALDTHGPPQTYRLASSAFLYITHGSARLDLDAAAACGGAGLDLNAAAPHRLVRGYACHAGQGAVLTVADVTEPLHGYLLHYQADTGPPLGEEAQHALAHTEAFAQSYGVQTVRAAALDRLLAQLETTWARAGSLAQLQTKALFYQFVCELMTQLHEALPAPQTTQTWQAAPILRPMQLPPTSALTPAQQSQPPAPTPDLVRQAARYMDEHYAEPITAEALAARLNCSPRTLQRLFGKRLALGPIDYLMQLRIDRAKTLLQSTRAPLKAIAEAVGYADSYYFSRLFKRYAGVSPSEYRTAMEQARAAEEGACPDPSIRCAAEDADSRGGAQATDPLQAAVRRALPTVVHLRGELSLHRRPRRIAVLDPQFLDHLLALDTPPAGSVTVPGDGGFPTCMTASPAGAIEPLGTLASPRLDALCELAPDLIICTELQAPLYPSLATIAPTAMLPRNRDWRETLRTLGRITDRRQEAERILQRYRHKTSELRSRLSERLHAQSVTMIRPRHNAIRLHTSAHRTASILYKDLGLRPPEQAMYRKRTSSAIALDTLPELDTDHYFVLTDDTCPRWTRDLQHSAVWRNLRAVREQHIYPASSSLWIAYYGPIAMNQVVDQVAAAFLKAR